MHSDAYAYKLLLSFIYVVCPRDFVGVGFRQQVLPALPRNLRPGFFKLVQKVLRVAEGGLLHGGPPCSSFVWMNSGTSCRSKEMPQGRKNVKSVQIANANLGGNQTENVFVHILYKMQLDIEPYNN